MNQLDSLDNHAVVGLDPIPADVLNDLVCAAVNSDPWITAPVAAFGDWTEQRTGSDGKPYSVQSKKQFLAMWRTVVKFMQDHALSVATITGDQLELFLISLPGRNGALANIGTRQRYLKLLQPTFREIVRRGLRTDSPCGLLLAYNVREEDQTPVGFGDTEDQRFIDALMASPVHDWKDLRDQAMIALTIGSGMYSNEVLTLSVPDLRIYTENPHVVVIGHGGISTRRVPIAEYAIAPLKAWMQYRMELEPIKDEPVFVSRKASATGERRLSVATFYRLVQARIDKEGATIYTMRGKGPQVLRNAFLMRQLADGKALEDVQRWAGHTEIKSTLRFKPENMQLTTV